MKKNKIELNKIYTSITENPVDVIIKNHEPKVFEKFMKAVTSFKWMEENNSIIEFGYLFLFFNSFDFEIQNVKLLEKMFFNASNIKMCFSPTWKFCRKDYFFHVLLRKNKEKITFFRIRQTGTLLRQILPPKNFFRVFD